MNQAPVFISYSRKQFYFAESLALNLQNLGLPVWFDVHKLTPGSDWSVGIQEGLDHCESILLVASQASLNSPYVAKEWQSAIQAGKPVYVVFFEEAKLPEDLKTASTIDMRTNFNKGVRRIYECIVGGRTYHDSVPPSNFLGMPRRMPFSAFWVSVMLMSSAIGITSSALDSLFSGLLIGVQTLFDFDSTLNTLVIDQLNQKTFNTQVFIGSLLATLGILYGYITWCFLRRSCSYRVIQTALLLLPAITTLSGFYVLFSTIASMLGNELFINSDASSPIARLQFIFHYLTLLFSALCYLIGFLSFLVSAWIYSGRFVKIVYLGAIAIITCGGAIAFFLGGGFLISLSVMATLLLLQTLILAWFIIWINSNRFFKLALLGGASLLFFGGYSLGKFLSYSGVSGGVLSLSIIAVAVLPALWGVASALLIFGRADSIYRWTPTAQVPVKRRFEHGEKYGACLKHAALVYQGHPARYSIYYALEDKQVAAQISKVMQKSGHTLAAPDEIVSHRIIVLSNKTPSSLLQKLSSAPQSLMPVIRASQVNNLPFMSEQSSHPT